MVTRQCPTCGADVRRPDAYAAKVERMFCNVRCYNVARLDYRPTASTIAKIRAAAAAKPPPAPNRTCIGCGVTFYRRASDVRGSQVFCSRNCYLPPVLDGICGACGSAMKLSHKGRKYCSMACYGHAVRGERIMKNGYALLLRPHHPRADVHGYVREHIVVAQAMLGRPLHKGEVVHHKNGLRADNRPENLRVFTSQAAHMAECHKGHARPSVRSEK